MEYVDEEECENCGGLFRKHETDGWMHVGLPYPDCWHETWPDR